MVFLYFFFFFNNMARSNKIGGTAHPAELGATSCEVFSALSEKGLGEGLGPSLLTHVYYTTHSVYSLLLSRFHGIAKSAAPSGCLLGALESFSRDCQRGFLRFWTVVFAFVLIRRAQGSLGLTNIVTTVSVPS